REIDILSRLKHRNIVTVHDCGRDHEHVYLVMDYVAGLPLDQAVLDPGFGTLNRFNRERASGDDQTKVQDPKSKIGAILRLFAKLRDGVNAAHLRGVIHRDLKPSNILVDEHGEPHVLDFGLAKLTDDSRDASPAAAMTVTGQFVGSLPWASPEQAEGRTDQ